MPAGQRTACPDGPVGVIHLASYAAPHASSFVRLLAASLHAVLAHGWIPEAYVGALLGEYEQLLGRPRARAGAVSIPDPTADA